MDFEIHEELAADTAFIADWALSRVLLMNDQRFVWLILVPRRAGVCEIFDLNGADQQTLMTEVCRAGENLKKLTGADKVNICAIGNQVPQLHIHIIARKTSDDVWPSPVWSRGFAVPYGDEALKSIVETLVNGL